MSMLEILITKQLFLDFFVIYIFQTNKKLILTYQWIPKDFIPPGITRRAFNAKLLDLQQSAFVITYSNIIQQQMGN